MVDFLESIVILDNILLYYRSSNTVKRFWSFLEKALYLNKRYYYYYLSWKYDEGQIRRVTSIIKAWQSNNSIFVNISSKTLNDFSRKGNEARLEVTGFQSSLPIDDDCSMLHLKNNTIITLKIRSIFNTKSVNILIEVSIFKQFR